MQANAASFPSKLGGGVYGYLGLTMDSADYLAATGENFVLHINPGVSPKIPATGVIGIVLDTLERTCKNNLRLFREQQKLNNTLRNQLVNTFEAIYLKVLKEKYVEFFNRSIL